MPKRKADDINERRVCWVDLPTAALVAEADACLLPESDYVFGGEADRDKLVRLLIETNAGRNDEPPYNYEPAAATRPEPLDVQNRRFVREVQRAIRDGRAVWNVTGKAAGDAGDRRRIAEMRFKRKPGHAFGDIQVRFTKGAGRWRTAYTGNVEIDDARPAQPDRG